MAVKILVEDTPNPNAIKFIVDRKLKEGGGIEFKKGQASDVELVETLLSLEGVSEIYIFQNNMSILKTDQADWRILEDKILEIIKNKIETHNPSIQSEKKSTSLKFDKKTQESIDKINLILDHNVRPALQADGGDLEIVNFADNVLTISYVGACNNCPSAILGTLRGIEDILRHEYNKDITLKATNDLNMEENFFY